jgi:ABC-type sugar transport system permease subunit
MGATAGLAVQSVATLVGRPVAHRAPIRRRRRMRRGKQDPYVLLLPSLLLVIALMGYPIIDLFYIAFHRTTYFRIGAFSWVDNFAPLMGAEGFSSLVATAEFVVASVALVLLIALPLAIALDAPLRWRGALRTLVLVPWLVSPVVAALLWQALVNPSFGPIPWFAALVGWHIAPLAGENSAMAVLVVANVWRSYPYALVLLLAAVQGVPSELYEAARLDGATAWQELRFVLLPMIRRTTGVVIVLLTFESLTNVTIPFIITDGGPNDATDVLALRILNEAFINYHFGTAAAIGVVLFLLNLGIAITFIRHFITRVHDRVS